MNCIPLMKLSSDISPRFHQSTLFLIHNGKCKKKSIREGVTFQEKITRGIGENLGLEQMNNSVVIIS